jgi:hypothetical protein
MLGMPGKHYRMVIRTLPTRFRSFSNYYVVIPLTYSIRRIIQMQILSWPQLKAKLQYLSVVYLDPQVAIL